MIVTKVEKIYYAPLSELFNELNFYTICAIIGLALIVMGFLLDLAYITLQRKRNKLLLCGNQKDQEGNHDNEVSEEMEEEEQKREFMEILKEVTQIKEDINKLTASIVPPGISENNNIIIQTQSISY